MKKIVLLGFITLLLNACIPTRDLTYFQGTPKDKKEIHKIQHTPYRLHVNDIIDIKIKAADDKLVALFKSTDNSINGAVSANKLYFDSYSVDKNGMIRIPYLNDLNVLGYTTKEVRIKIENQLSKIFKNMDEIFVTVKLAGIRYTIIGEVNSPGSKVLFQNQANIIEAIANSGDITFTGNRKNVSLIRNTIDGVKKYNLDLTKFDFMDEEGFYIQPNDIIYVAPRKEKSWGTGQTGTKTMSTIITALSLLTTSIILINRL